MIPSLAKAADKGIAKKLVEVKVFLNTLGNGHLTNIPAVIVKTYNTLAKLFFADRIKSTTNRLAEVGTSCSVSLF